MLFSYGLTDDEKVHHNLKTRRSIWLKWGCHWLNFEQNVQAFSMAMEDFKGSTTDNLFELGFIQMSLKI